LYVAVSRVTSEEALKILIIEENSENSDFTSNVVMTKYSKQSYVHDYLTTPTINYILVTNTILYNMVLIYLF